MSLLFILITYFPISQTIYITWSKGCWWLFLLLLSIFYQKIIIVRLYLGWQRTLVFISNFKYFWQNDSWFEWYSQTCSNHHLYKTTTRLWQPMLSPSKQIPKHLLPTTNGLTGPATTFFVSQMKENLSKTTTTKPYPAKK